MVQIEDVLDVLMVQIVTGYGFEDLQIIQDAIDRRGPIPLNYFTDEDILGCGWRSKAELRKIRQKIIDKIVSIINAQNRLPYKEKCRLRIMHAICMHLPFLKSTNTKHCIRLAMTTSEMLCWTYGF